MSIKALDTLRPGLQWVCYDHEKMPYNPVTGSPAKANDPSTWASYEQAVNALETAPGRYIGIGREFVRDQGITGIDLDHSVNEQGQLTEYARYVVGLLDSYTEYSPSRRGLHIWVRGSIPKSIGPNPDLDGEQCTEMYSHARYFTYTGNHLAGTPESIEDRQEQVLQLHNEVSERRRLARMRDQAPAISSQPVARASAGDTPYGLAALKGLCADLAGAGEGGRNHRLNECAFRAGQLIGGGELVRATVERDLYNAAAATGLDDREIQATMRSGLDSGERDPKSAPATSVLTWPTFPTGASQAGGNGHGNHPSVERVLECLAQEEYGDGALFADLFNGTCLFDHTAQEWYLWHKHAWKRDDTNKIFHYVSGYLSSVYLATAATIAKETGGDEDQENKRKKKMAALYKRAQDIRTIARSRNVLRYAATYDGVGIMADQWDTNPWRLATVNGVIDLRTGECRPGEPGDYIRTVSPTEWEGLEALAPRWMRFLHEIFELKCVDGIYIRRSQAERLEMVNFLQRLLGYGITGLVREQVFAVFYGEEGRNGKDTLQKAISHALGAQSGAVSNDILLDTGKQHNAGGPTPHLSALQGKRIAWANEPEKGARFNVGQVKLLSGEGQITTRNLHEKRYTDFDPTFLLVLLTNHKPYADADDNAFWQRLRLVTFDMSFVDKPAKENERKKDTTLWDALKSEAPGILAWLVRGCLEWQRIGLAAPDNVLQAGNDYRLEVDTIASFIGERCLVGPDYHVRSKQIYDAYSAWCKDGNMHPQSSKNFGMTLAKRYRKAQDARGVYYVGLALIDQDGGGGESVEGETNQLRENGGRNFSLNNPMNRPVERGQHTNTVEVSGGSGGCLQEIVISPSDFTKNDNYLKSPSTPSAKHSYSDGMNGPVERDEPTIEGEKAPSIVPQLDSEALLSEVKRRLAAKRNIFWHVPGSEIGNGNISLEVYIDRLRTCLASGDAKRIRAAQDEIASRMG